MKIRNIIASLGIFTSLSLANDMFINVNTGYYDGKANSTSNTADDNTIISTIDLGKKYNKDLVFYLSYDYISWNDAKAQDLILNVNYIIPKQSFEYYLGAGLGKMKFEVDEIDKGSTKAVATLKAGINYKIDKSLYLSSGLRYLYTNDIKVKDENIYSSLDNMLGLQVGLGYKF